MGRTLPEARACHPPGFYKEMNTSMLHDVWLAMADRVAPGQGLANRAPMPSIHTLMEMLGTATWEDFWQVFPFELRDPGSHWLDEVDALTLLLSLPMSKQRFERFFEQHVSSTPAPANVLHAGRQHSRQLRQVSSGLQQNTAARRIPGTPNQAGTSRAQGQQQLPLPAAVPGRHLVSEGLVSTATAAAAGRQHIRWMHPAGLSPFEQQPAGRIIHNDPVVYVGPAAPGRRLAAAHPGARAAFIQPAPPAATIAAAAASPFARQPAPQQGDYNILQYIANQVNLVNGVIGDTAAPTMQYINALRSAMEPSRAWPLADQAGAPAAAAAGPAAGRQATDPGAAGTAIAAAAAAAATMRAARLAPAPTMRLTGRRRSWLEACELDEPEHLLLPGPTRRTPTAAALQARQWNQQAQQITQQQPQPAVATAAGPAATASMQVANVAAANSPAAPWTQVDNGNMWRAVHEWLTGDDETLLAAVCRIVPCSSATHLTDEQQSRKQLQQLASSRPVPAQVVQAISDRLSASSGSQLLRLTASSGYSRRAAAAAAGLACSTRTPFYIPMGGCCTEEDIEAAVMKSLFSGKAQQHQDVQFDSGYTSDVATAAGCGPHDNSTTGIEGAVAAAEAGGNICNPVEQGDVGSVQGAEAQQPGASHGANGNSNAGQPPQQQQHGQQQGVPVADIAAAVVGVVAGTAAAAARATDELNRQNSGLHDVMGQQQQPGDTVQHQGHTRQPAGDLMRNTEVLDLTQESEGASEGLDEILEISVDESEEGWERCEMCGAEMGPCQCSEQLNAYLMLLGTCRQQPLVLLFDEIDTAAMVGEGQPFRDLLLRVLCHLPQAVVIMTGSFDPEILIDSPVLRQQGRVVKYQMPDGQLNISSYRIPTPLFYHCMHCL